MKRIIVVLVVFLLLSSCSVTNRLDSIVGQYSGNLLMSTMNLSLNADQTFHIELDRFNYTGKWRVLDGKHILLMFDKRTDNEILFSGLTLTGQDITVKLLRRHKARMLPIIRDCYGIGYGSKLTMV